MPFGVEKVINFCNQRAQGMLRILVELALHEFMDAWWYIAPIVNASGHRPGGSGCEKAWTQVTSGQVC